MKKVDAVIPVYGCLFFLYRTTRALEAHRECVRDIVIVDDCSPDQETRDWIGGYDCVPIYHDKNEGFTKTCNDGIRWLMANNVSRSDYIILLNQDCLPTEGWASSMLKCAEETGAGIVGCKLRDARFPDIVIHAGCPERSVHKSGKEPCFLERTFDDLYMTFACVMLSVPMLEQIGLLDESFRHYGSDEELCVRAKKHGWKVVYEPTSILLHYGGRSTELFRSLHGAMPDEVLSREPSPAALQGVI